MDHKAEVRLIGPTEGTLSPTETKENTIGIYREHGRDPLLEVEYENRVTILKDKDGGVVFENESVGGFKVPKSWSILAGDIAAEKYARKAGCTLFPGDRESTVSQIVARVSSKISEWGLQNGYFYNETHARNFQHELADICVNQYGAFNSPVWFNVGLDLWGCTGSGGNYYWGETGPTVFRGESIPSLFLPVRTTDSYTRPQSSACFILKRSDDLMSLFEGMKNEAQLFKHGSGAGSNWSGIRSRFEKLSGGGTSSGLMSFLRVYDAGAGSLKSGGTTRRAAKMVVLNDNHPEVMDFIKWKSGEEKKAKALVAAGYTDGMEGEAYLTVSGQNSNNSVCFSDEFMSVIAPGSSRKLWSTRLVTTGEVHQTFPAADLWRAVAVNTWECGDPGVHFGGTINEWHTCPVTGPINSSNPCCLTRETRVDTSEGRISIERLCEMYDSGEELPLVFAYDLNTRLPVLRPIKRVWVAGRTNKIVEVHTQRGLKIRCTPEHRFLLQDGTYVEARNLVSGMRLRKIARTVNDQRSNRKSIMHRITPNADNGCEYQNRWMWEQANGPVPEGYEVHHLNGDCTDDRLSNFALRTVTEHRQEHGAGEENPRYIDAADALLLETWEAVARMNNGRPSKVGQVTVARWNRYVKESGLQGQVPFANPQKGIRGLSWDEFSNWIGDRQLAANDRVAFVRPVLFVKDIPVYDLEVEGTNNFAVIDGTSDQEHTIVVHNSEYLFLDDTACNLASLNLLKYLKYKPINNNDKLLENSEPYFDIELFQHHCRILFIAQEILVGLSSYPTPQVAENSYKYRPLGLGHCNGGLMLMTLGIPYDSDEGRALMGAITSLMTATGYHTSTMLAQVKGPFEGYEANKEPFLRVMRKHKEADSRLGMDTMTHSRIPQNGRDFIQRIGLAAQKTWDEVLYEGERYGFRNAQATVLAPTGTIGFLMGAETTGAEPLFSIVMTKKYAGGSVKKIICEGAMKALTAVVHRHNENLPSHTEPLSIEHIEKFVLENGHVQGSGLPEGYWPIFATAGGNGKTLSWKSHIDMMAAMQPFLSGAISKTVNMDEEATVEDIEAAYLYAYQNGIKALAIYRNGSKGTQPLNTDKKKVEVVKDSFDSSKVQVEEEVVREPLKPVGMKGIPSMSRKEKMEDKAKADVYRVTVAGQKLYIHVGLNPEGKPLEVFVRGMKAGGAVTGLVDQWCIALSGCLQYGMPLPEVVDKFTFVSFAPAGGVQGHSSIKMCSSIIDFVARLLGFEYLGMTDLGHVEEKVEEPAIPMYFGIPEVEVRDYQKDQGPNTPGEAPLHQWEIDDVVSRRVENVKKIYGDKSSDAPPCDRCSHMTERNGRCFRCNNCGHSMGCS